METKRIYKTRGRLSPDRIIALYLEGVGTRELATLNQTTRGAVCALLRRHAIPARRYGGPQQHFKKGQRIKGKLTPAEMSALYTSGTTITKLTKLDGTTGAAVTRCLRRYGVKLRGREPSFKHRMCSQARKLGIAKETFTRFLAITVLGGRCVCCGNTDLRLLQINHLLEKTAHPTYCEYVQIIKGSLKNRDVRCANCNLLYEFERGRRKLPEQLKDLLNTCVKSQEFQQFLQSTNL